MDGRERRAATKAKAKPRAPTKGAPRATSDTSGVSGRMTSRLLRLLEQRGHALAPVLEAAKTTRDAVEACVLRVPYVVADRLVCAVADALGDADLGAAIAGIYDVETYDAAGHVLLASPTFGEGLARSFAYQRLWGDGERFTLEAPRGGTFAVGFRHPGRSARAASILTETAFCEILAGARMLANPAIFPREVRFATPRPARPSAWRELFGVVPVFGAFESSIVFDEALFGARVVLPDGLLAGLVERAAAAALRDLPERTAVSRRVVAVLGAGPDAFEATLDDVARRLHMSARTLQRKLAAEGTTYEHTLDMARKQRAEAMTARGASGKEIVYWLGFRDASALRRARARWERARETE